MGIRYLTLLLLCSCYISACSTDEPNSSKDVEETIISNSGHETTPEPLTDCIRPVLSDGKRWIYEITESNRTERFTVNVERDTIVNGLSAKIVTKSTDDFWFAIPLSGIMREENGVVYNLFPVYGDIFSHQPIGTNFVMMYDILASLPLEIETYNSYAIPESSGVIQLQGKLRRAVKVKFRDPDLGYDYWVESIGSLKGIVPFPVNIMPSIPKPNMIPIIQCFDGDDLIYDISEFSDDLYTEIELIN